MDIAIDGGFGAKRTSFLDVPVLHSAWLPSQRPPRGVTLHPSQEVARRSGCPVHRKKGVDHPECLLGGSPDPHCPSRG